MARGYQRNRSDFFDKWWEGETEDRGREGKGGMVAETRRDRDSD